MRSPFLVLLSLAFTLLVQAAEPYAHKGTGLSFPDELAGFKRDKETLYDTEPGQTDVAIPYNVDGTAITIFVTSIPAGKTPPAPADVVNASLSAVKEMEKRGLYSAIKFFENTETTADPLWAKGGYQARDQKDRSILSFVYATILRGHALKVRITTHDFSKPEVIGTFMKELRQKVDAAR